MDQRCRMCAEIVEGSLSLFDTSHQELLDWINGYLEFNSDDATLPKQICIPCKDHIESCINFKKRCNVASNQFFAILASTPNPLQAPDKIYTTEQHSSSATFLDKWLQEQREVTRKLNSKRKIKSLTKSKEIASKKYTKLIFKYNIKRSFVRLELLSQNQIRKYTKDTATVSDYLSSQSNHNYLIENKVKERSSKEMKDDGLEAKSLSEEKDDVSTWSGASTEIAPVFSGDLEDSVTSERSKSNIEEPTTWQHSGNCHGSDELPKEPPRVVPKQKSKITGSRWKKSSLGKTKRHKTGRALSAHGNDKPFKCHQCSKGFKLACYLKQHTKTVHSCVSLYKCEQCLSTFTLRSNMLQHVKRMHNKSWDFKCDTCSKLFKTKGELVNHSLSHATERPFKCNKCSLAVKSKGHLREHMKRVHCDIRRFVCPQCKKGFKYSGNLSEHIQGVHGTESKFACPKCDKTFKRKGVLKQHLIIHENKQFYKCEFCSKTFCHPANFQRHIKTVHKKILPYKCHICKKMFASKGQMKNHMICHNDERNSKCDLCSKMFKAAKAVERHKKTVHSDIRPFTCAACDKSFKSKTELRSHILYHSKKRNFQCETCGKKFISPSNWREHVLRMHKNVCLYKCKECINVRFRVNADLKKHMKENHYETVL